MKLAEVEKESWAKTEVGHEPPFRDNSPSPLWQSLPLLRRWHRSQEVVPGPGLREEILQWDYDLWNLLGQDVLCIWWGGPCGSFPKMPPVTNTHITGVGLLSEEIVIFLKTEHFGIILWLCILRWPVVIKAVWLEHIYTISCYCVLLTLKFSFSYLSWFNLLSIFECSICSPFSKPSLQ